MSPTATIPVLPTSISLLLHLHILSYPQCSSPEYSTPGLFAQTRPLRERAKTMEDIVAFLIEKIEGRTKCKAVLNGAYPCLQSSDSVSFRINASKYIESLRHNAIRFGGQPAPISKGAARATSTSSSKAKRGDDQGSRGPSPATVANSAWWWTNIVVRRSLLEECRGDKFEKLLLSLSTHALFSRIASASPLHPVSTEVSTLMEILQKQPEEYSTFLYHSMEAHVSRIRQVTRLNSRASSLLQLRENFALNPHRDDTPPVDLSRLAAIRDSRKEEIISAWDTTLGKRKSESDISATEVVQWLLDVAGVGKTEDLAGPSSRLVSNVEGSALVPEGLATPQPLPIAAAHHPGNIHKITTLPPFIDAKAQSQSTGAPQEKEPTKLISTVLQEMFDHASEQQRALQEALERAVRQGDILSSKLESTIRNRGEVRDRRGKSVQLWVMKEADFSENVMGPILDDPIAFKYLKDVDIFSSTTEETDSQIEEKFETDVLILRESLKPRFPTPTSGDVPLTIHSILSPLSLTGESASRPAAPPLPSTPPRSSSSNIMKSTPKFVTPRTNRRSTLLPSIIAASGKGFDESLLADLALPDVSFGEEGAEEETWGTRLSRLGRNERQSMTLRDILLNAGDGDESFDLMGGSNGSETDEELEVLEDIPELE